DDAADLWGSGRGASAAWLTAGPPRLTSAYRWHPPLRLFKAHNPTASASAQLTALSARGRLSVTRGTRQRISMVAVASAVIGGHPDGAVESDALPVEHGVRDDVSAPYSAGWPRRAGCGTWRPSALLASSSIWASRGVSKRPGAMVTTLILSPARSR